ncbi:MAG TPA: phosphate-starvation-inducible PsiE family protein [Ktedonobacteraceae bacterium]|nr:phosphate-starvation-inducible PsiE family protein [Ktedonobacteraceae bacterium]
MSDHQIKTQEDHTLSGLEMKPSEQDVQRNAPEPLSPVRAGQLLDRADNIVYIIVGVCFFLAALFVIGFGLWNFITTLLQVPSLGTLEQPSFIVAAIVHLIADLLLVLIIAEVLGTIVHYLNDHVTSLRPYLGIGIISAIRVILALGAELLTMQESTQQDFLNIMIELGVTTGVILVLSITLKMLERHGDISSTH